MPCSLVVWRSLQLELVAGKKPAYSRVGVDLIAGQDGACCSKEPGEVGDLPETCGFAWRELSSFVSRCWLLAALLCPRTQVFSLR